MRRAINTTTTTHIVNHDDNYNAYNSSSSIITSLREFDGEYFGSISIVNYVIDY